MIENGQARATPETKSPLQLITTSVAALLWLAALIALLLFLLFFAFRSWNILTFPHQVEHVEGLVLSWSQQIAAGTLPYKPIDAFPWNFSVYTPAYVAASALTLDWFAGSPWLGGRLISLLSALGLALLLPAQALQQRRGRVMLVGGVLTAGLWLATPYLFRWATFYRPDMFALLWSALGIVLVQRAASRQRLPLLIPAALCFVAAFWSKQSFFAAPLAALLYLLVTRRWRAFLLLGLTGAVGGVLVAWWLWSLSGPAIFENLILANANPYSWGAFWHFQRAFFRTVPLLLLLALGAMGRRPVRDDSSGQRPLLLTIYLLLALPVTISVGKAGAWENYFLESLWILCALATLGIAALLRAGGWQALLVPLLLLLQLLLFVPAFERRTPDAELEWLAELRTESEVVQRTLTALPPGATVWSEHAGVLSEAKRPVPLFVFGYTQFERQGLWDPTPLTNRLATGNGPLLVQRWDAVADPLGRDRWSRSMLNAAERGYALGERAGKWRQRPPFPFTTPDEPLALDEKLALLNWMALGSAEACLVPSNSVCLGERLGGAVELQAGEPLILHLLWRSERGERIPLSSSVQLFAPDGQRVAQHDAPLRLEGLGGALPAGALVRDEHTLTLPDDLSPGAYSLLLSLYESDSGAVRGTITLPYFKVTPPSPTASLSIWRDVEFGEGLRLLARDPLPTAAHPGDTISLRAHWAVERRHDASLTTFLHLIAPDGSLVAQSDFVPSYPPTLWGSDEAVEIVYDLPLPADLPPGRYEVRLGWYDSATFARLPAQSERAVEGALSLGTIDIGE